MIFEALYCFFVFTDIPAIRRLREAYISTALTTFSHQWMATYFLPEYQVEQVRLLDEQARKNQENTDSNRPSVTTPSTDPNNSDSTETSEPSEAVDLDEEGFYETFWELNRTDFEAYLEKYPEVLENGWGNISLNESGINEDGLDLYTSTGEQVLAIDAKNKILLLRVTGTGYLGVLAVAKDPALLRCHASVGLGKYGQSLDELVINGDAILGMTGSGFYDPNGGGNGGIIAGYARCEGVDHGVSYTQPGYKRIELTEDNRLYIIEASKPVADDVTDAVEFTPALIVDGERFDGDYPLFNGIHPRAAIGQSESGEILMLIIEGRQATRSMGASMGTCADILLRHKCYTALNLDGGTSAVMWYDGQYVTKCSNTDISSRLLPNAWVYGNSD